MGKTNKAVYITPKEAAELAQVTPSTIYRWLDEGDIEGAFVASSRFVDKASLLKHLGPDFEKVKGGA